LKKGSVFRYEYNLTDHLGNVRISFADVDEDGSIDETMEVLTSQSFYPFGLRLGGLSTTTGVPNRYRYNGKELHDELGLGWYDYGARMYDPSVGRFTTIDRFSEKYLDMTAYQYAANNPVLFIDVNGDSIKINYEGNDILYQDGKLYDSNRNEYRGEGVKVKKDGSIKYKGFLKKSFNALNKIATTKAGAAMIDALETSEQNVILKYQSGAANFVPGFESFGNPDLKNNAEGLRVKETGKKVLAFFDFTEIGSGGIVYWDPAVRPDGGKPTMVLAHELFHGLDATKGMLDSRRVAVGKGYEEIQEIRAVYNTNLIRKELGLKIRSNYSGGPSLLDGKGKTINVSPPYKSPIGFK